MLTLFLSLSKYSTSEGDNVKPWVVLDLELSYYLVLALP